jgi:hypothetical protein
MVTQGEDGRFYKPCPECSVMQSYARKNYAEHSLNSGKVCRPCSNKNMKPHQGWYRGVLRASFAHKYKVGAETRGIEWSLDFDYLADLLIAQDFKCALSGLPLQAMDICSNASLDRIDSTQGYIIGNVQWVLSEVNMMKQSYTQSRFIEICNAISNNNQGEQHE